jgi:glycosyltransferase involved in cell wall biosynthesis
VKTCAIIPAFNEERHIGEVARAVIDRGIPALVVDDCSADRTSSVARRVGATVITHESNTGKGGALATGFAWASENGYDAAIALDGDGQHDPAEIGRFLVAGEHTRADIIVGSRMSAARDMPPVRKATNWFMSMVLSWMAGQRLTDTQSGYRLIRTDAWRRLGLSTSRFDAESEMLVRACRMGMVVREVPIRTIYGDEKSHMRPVRDTLRWIRLLWRMSRMSFRPTSRP